jgi:hypothetical protein
MQLKGLGVAIFFFVFPWTSKGEAKCTQLRITEENYQLAKKQLK